MARQTSSHYDNRQNHDFGNQITSNNCSGENKEPTSRGGYKGSGGYDWKNQNTI